MILLKDDWNHIEDKCGTLTVAEKEEIEKCIDESSNLSKGVQKLIRGLTRGGTFRSYNPDEHDPR